MKVLLIHGFEASNESHWFPCLEAQLLERGCEVLNLNFPNADHPDLNELLEFYDSHMKSVDVVLEGCVHFNQKNFPELLESF